MTKEELEKEAEKQSYLYDTKYSEDYTLEDRLNRPKDFVKGAIKDLVDLLKRKSYRDGYIAGAKVHQIQRHDLRKNPDDLPEEMEDVIIYASDYGMNTCYVAHRLYGKWWSNCSSERFVHVLAWWEKPTFVKE